MCAVKKRTNEAPKSKYALKGAAYHYEGVDLRRVAFEAEKIVKTRRVHVTAGN